MCYSRIPPRSSTWCRLWQRCQGIVRHLQLRLLRSGGGGAPAPGAAVWPEVRAQSARLWGFSSLQRAPRATDPVPSQPCPSCGHVCQCGLQSQRGQGPCSSRASQQDECRFGSQAGGNPGSLLWLRAPADLQPGFAVIPTSCCRSLISWRQPGKKTPKPKPQTVVVKAPHCQVVGRGGQQPSQAPGGGREGLAEITVSLVGMEAENRVFVPAGGLCRTHSCRSPAEWMGLGLRHGLLLFSHCQLSSGHCPFSPHWAGLETLWVVVELVFFPFNA